MLSSYVSVGIGKPRPTYANLHLYSYILSSNPRLVNRKSRFSSKFFLLICKTLVNKLVFLDGKGNIQHAAVILFQGIGRIAAVDGGIHALNFVLQAAGIAQLYLESAAVPQFQITQVRHIHAGSVTQVK